MEPMYLGAGNEIFGFFHPDESGLARGNVLICPPFFGEYYRTYQVLKETAFELARKGYNVMRFDYRGTGDSSLSFHETTPAMWIDDINTSIRELAELCGNENIRIISVRLSSVLASRAIRLQDFPKIRHLLCWDPVVNGHKYIESMRNTFKSFQETHKIERGKPASIAEDELMGYRLTQAIQEEIAGMSLADELALITEPPTLTVLDSLNAGYAPGNIPVTTQSLNFDCNWNTMAANMLFIKEIVDQLVLKTSHP